jgi:hypothetical protein
MKGTGIQYELLAAARDGDQERFDALFDTWVLSAYAAALKRADGERARAEELTSALMIGMVQSALAAVECDASAESTNPIGKAALAH